MQKLVILLRGINVGGKNMLPMKELIPLLKTNDYQDVSTYIQTGNIVLNALKNSNPEQENKNIITNLIANHFSFTPNVFVITADEFNTVINNNPYKNEDGKLVHLYFCEQNIDLNLDKTNKWLADSETYQVKNNVLYLYAPNGIGRSKLVANIEACLGQASTGRNLNTVNKITVMIEG